jgi:hypothetical protein
MAVSVRRSGWSSGSRATGRVSVDRGARGAVERLPSRVRRQPVNGNVYAVWQDARFSPTGASKIAFSQSTDGGLSWSPVIRIDQSLGNTQAFLPQIHVASDGTVGLLYYDLENATAAQPGADRRLHRPPPLGHQ